MINLGIIRKYLIYAAFALVFLAGIKIYSLYFNKLDFGDEYDNMVAPWLMSKGYVLYRDFFSHHFPLLFFIGWPLEFLGHTKFLYRILMFALTFTSFSLFFMYLKGLYKYSILPFILIASFGINLYGGQQFADGPLWALMLLGAFFVVVDAGRSPFGKKRTLLFSLLSFMMFLTSPVHLVAFLILALLHIFLQIKNKKDIAIYENFQDLKFYFLTVFAFAALFLIYLLISKSLGSFIYDAFGFNSSIYFFRESKLITGFKPIDVYLNALHEVYIHFYLLIKNEGFALLTFFRASKFLFLPFAFHGQYFDYAKVIFTDLYNNFFSLEMIIALFYLSGIITFLLQKRFAFAVFIIIFLLPLRLRIATNTHLSPYYLFSFWLVALTLAFSFLELTEKKRALVNLLICFGTTTLIALFIAKDWYSFDQTAFNSFPKENRETVDYLKTSPLGSKIIVFRDFSASYYYESNRLPFGYFTNFFPWYNQSARLNNILVNELGLYGGDYLVVNKKDWDGYKNQSSINWRDQYFKIIDYGYKISKITDKNYIFERTAKTN